jgi:hypothetical protein
MLFVLPTAIGDVLGVPSPYTAISSNEMGTVSSRVCEGPCLRRCVIART